MICNYLSGVVRLQPLRHYILHFCCNYGKSSIKGIIKIKKNHVLLNYEPPNDRRRTCHSSLWSSHRDESNGGKIVLLQSLDGSRFGEMSAIRHFLLIHLCSLRHFTFRLIASHPVIVERRFYHHSIRLDETITTSYGTFFYDHWVAHNLMKREMAQWT